MYRDVFGNFKWMRLKYHQYMKLRRQKKEVYETDNSVVCLVSQQTKFVKKKKVSLKQNRDVLSNLLIPVYLCTTRLCQFLLSQRILDISVQSKMIVKLFDPRKSHVLQDEQSYGTLYMGEIYYSQLFVYV